MTNSDQPTDWRHVSLLWAQPEHANAIARVHASLFDEAWDTASIEKLLLHPGSVALVAGHGPQTIGGFALAQIGADEAEILTLGVGASWQRHGIGLRLIDGLKRAAAKGGAKTLFLDVAASNAAALGLYKKAGFTETGRRKAYYQHTGRPAEDAIQLKAALAPV